MRQVFRFLLKDRGETAILPATLPVRSINHA